MSDRNELCDITEPNTIPVFNAYFARTLFKEGYKLVDFSKNLSQKNRMKNATIFYFEDDGSVTNRLKELINENEQDKQKDGILQEGD